MSASDADRSALAGVHAAWVSAVAAGDAESLRTLVTDDYEVWANAAQPIAGADAVVSAMRAALERFHVQQRFDPIETVIAGDWAFERGIESMTVTPIGGGTPQTRGQRALLILHRDAYGRWRYARGMTNELPAETGRGRPSSASNE
jgi:uncharacterized protein (TIGR02246 family)